MVIYDHNIISQHSRHMRKRSMLCDRRAYHEMSSDIYDPALRERAHMKVSDYSIYVCVYNI